MRTIPMKARKLHNSWAHHKGGVLAESLIKREREKKWANRRYAFSIFLFAFALTGLVMGSIGGIVHEASAQSRGDAWRNWLGEFRFGQNSRNTNQQSDRTQTTQREETEREEAPAQVAPVSPDPIQPNEQTSTDTATEVAPSALPSIVSPAAQAELAPEPVIPDTAEEIVSTTSAQATVESQPIAYTSRQISNETRDRLLAVAAMAVASALVIFILSLFETGSAAVSAAHSARVRVLVREVATR